MRKLEEPFIWHPQQMTAKPGWAAAIQKPSEWQVWSVPIQLIRSADRMPWCLRCDWWPKTFRLYLETSLIAFCVRPKGEAAEDGLAITKRLQGAGYDLEEVTPDADSWKFGPFF